MRRIRREGARAFTDEDSDSESDSGLGSVTPSKEADTARPEVSILPIVDGRGKAPAKEEEVLQEAAEAILQRGEEEVVAAMERAEESEPIKVQHEEL